MEKLGAGRMGSCLGERSKAELGSCQSSSGFRFHVLDYHSSPSATSCARGQGHGDDRAVQQTAASASAPRALRGSRLGADWEASEERPPPRKTEAAGPAAEARGGTTSDVRGPSQRAPCAFGGSGRTAQKRSGRRAAPTAGTRRPLQAAGGDTPAAFLLFPLLPLDHFFFFLFFC